MLHRQRKDSGLTPSHLLQPKREILPLVILLAAGALTAVFGFLAESLFTGGLDSFDRSILLSFRDAADPSKPLGRMWLHIAARDVTSLGSPAILSLMTAFATGFLLLQRRAREALLLVSAVVTGVLVSNALKSLIERARPDIVAEVALTQTYSFPSGHAFLSALTFLTIGALLARNQEHYATKVFLISVAIVLSFLVGLSRLYLGVHWPTDVMAGWCAGASWAILWWLAETWLQKRGALSATADRHQSD